MDFPLVGKFMKREDKVTFIPHIDFIASGRFQFPQNQYNVSPLSKRVPKSGTEVKVSLGAISAQCDYDRDLVASIIKDVMVKFVSLLLKSLIPFNYRSSPTEKARMSL